MKRRFPKETVAEIRDGSILRIRAGTEPHRIIGPMLAVCIDDENPFAGSVANSGLYRGAVSLIVRMTNDARACGRCACRRIVARAVVDHEDFFPRRSGPQAIDNARDGCALVKRWNDDGGCCGISHG